MIAVIVFLSLVVLALIGYIIYLKKQSPKTKTVNKEILKTNTIGEIIGEDLLLIPKNSKVHRLIVYTLNAFYNRLKKDLPTGIPNWAEDRREIIDAMENYLLNDVNINDLISVLSQFASVCKDLNMFDETTNPICEQRLFDKFVSMEQNPVVQKIGENIETYSLQYLMDRVPLYV